MPITPAFKRQMQEDGCKFKDSLGYIVRLLCPLSTLKEEGIRNKIHPLPFKDASPMTQLFQVGPRQGFYFLPMAHEIIAHGKMAPQTVQSPHELIILKVPPLNCVELGTGLSPSALLCFRPKHSRGNPPYKKPRA